MSTGSTTRSAPSSADWESLTTDQKRRLRDELARMSPAALAALHSRGRWLMAPHLKLLDCKLRAVCDGSIKRLKISMPPRHGKSELASKYFPAWWLGNRPDDRVILCSYEADFAASWGRKVRDILEEIGDRVFRVTVRRDSSAADRWDIDDHLGGMNTAGVCGPITGKGAHLLIIDDPVKDAEQANSETYRERAWDWYRSTAYSRLEPDGSIILIQTRWHEEDLAGRVAKHAKETGERWESLDLPALSLGAGDPLGRPEGEPLWADRYDRAALLQIQSTLGGYWWSALYQGSPQPAEGGCFKRSWLRYWTRDGELYLLSGRPVAAKHCRVFLTVDLAFSLKKESDYTVIAAWAVTPRQDLICLDLHRERLEGPEILPAIQAMARRHRAAYVGIEDVAAQALVIQAARKAGLTVRSLKADRDKLSRAIPATVRMEAGQIYLPESAPWLDEFIAELLSFPHGAHDDQVDVLAYAAVEVQRFGPAAEPESYEGYREYAEKELAAEFFNRAENPLLWLGDTDGDD